MKLTEAAVIYFGWPPVILLRENYRDNGKSRKRALANLSAWSLERVDQLRAVLRGETLLPASEASKSFELRVKFSRNRPKLISSSTIEASRSRTIKLLNQRS